MFSDVDVAALYDEMKAWDPVQWPSDVAPLNAFLQEAGFEVEEQFGAWDRTPVGPSSKQVFTIARRV